MTVGEWNKEEKQTTQIFGCKTGVLSWVPTKKLFAHDNITMSKFEINIKYICRIGKALYSLIKKNVKFVFQ